MKRNRGLRALSQNRLREADDLLDQVDAEHGWAGEALWFWRLRTATHHLLGEYDQELRDADRLLAIKPSDPAGAKFMKARALVALGRVPDAMTIIDDFASEAPSGTIFMPNVYAALGEELLAHGYERDGRSVLDRGVGWCRSEIAARSLRGRPGAADERIAMTAFQAEMEYDLGRLDEAARLAREQLGRLAPNGEMATRARVVLGKVAARRGNREEAEATRRTLERVTDPGLDGLFAIVGAVHISALLGDNHDAINRLPALIHVHDYVAYLLIHREPWPRALSTDPAFQRFIRGKI